MLESLRHGEGTIQQRQEQRLTAQASRIPPSFLLRGKFSHELFPLNKVQGLPFKVSEIEVKIEELL